MRLLPRDEKFFDLFAAVATYTTEAAGLQHDLLRADDPQVATYARVEAVDVRVSSSGPGAADRVAPVAAIEGLEKEATAISQARDESTPGGGPPAPPRPHSRTSSGRSE